MNHLLPVRYNVATLASIVSLNFTLEQFFLSETTLFAVLLLATSPVVAMNVAYWRRVKRGVWKPVDERDERAFHRSVVVAYAAVVLLFVASETASVLVSSVNPLPAGYVAVTGGAVVFLTLFLGHWTVNREIGWYRQVLASRTNHD